MLLKKKIYISLVLSIVIPVCITVLFFSSSIKSQTETKLQNVDLPTALRELRNEIELELATPIIVSKEIAQNSYIKSWINNTKNDDETQKLVKHLSMIKEHNNAKGAFVVNSITKDYYSSDGFVRKISESSDQWFYDFLASDREYELSLDIDQSSEQAIVFINYNINVEGKRIGVGGIGRSLDSIVQLISDYRIGANGIVYLVSADGKIQLHADKAKIGKTINLTEVVDNTVLEKELNGETLIISSTPLHSLDWYLVAEIPKKQLFEGINNTVNHNIIIGFLIAICGLFVAHLLANQIFKPISDITKSVSSLNHNDGDLTTRLVISEGNEVGELASQFNAFLDKLHNMFKQVASTAISVESVTKDVLIEVNKSYVLADNQSHSTQTVAAAVNEMECTVKEISTSAMQAANVATQTEVATNRSATYLSDTINHMKELESSMGNCVNQVVDLSDEIGSISNVLDVIKGVSEQTNLLALNAAIEAARAGEQGRGFAVVADEVRTLAKRTAESTEQINEMISTLNSKASITVSSIETGSKETLENAERLEETGETLNGIAKEIVNLSSMNSTVASSTSEQSQATEEINQNIVMISDSALETRQNMEKSKNLCKKLNGESNTLKDLLSKFTI